MKTLRRFDIRNRYYFVTVVTYNRQQLLTDDIELFWQCWKIKKLHAWVILPDHFHVIIKIDDKSKVGQESPTPAYFFINVSACVFPFHQEQAGFLKK